MNTPFDIAKQTFLSPTGLTEGDLEHVLGQLHGPGIDAADVYFQAGRMESWMLEDGIIKSGNHTIERGVGVRAIDGEKTGFAYSEELTREQLLTAAKAARVIAHQGSNNISNSTISTTISNNGTELGVHLKIRDTNLIYAPLYQPVNPLLSIQDAEKIDLLKKVDAVVRAQDPRITQVIVSLVAAQDIVLIMDKDGVLHGDVRPLVRLSVNVIAEHKGRREQGSSGGGTRQNLTWFLENDRYKEFAKKAVYKALINLEATEAPAGVMTVVLGAGWPGVLLHEAIGHGLEGDFNRKGTSAFAGRIGEKVAVSGCTVVDDGTLMARRGSLTIDDEGTASQHTVLIEDGILKGYMQDQLNGRLMGVASTGNGRRESYSSLPIPRMTNTYMLPGKYTHDEIIASVAKGLYAVDFGGGQVDITSGKFVFSSSEAYLIENGRITKPVKGAMLIGNGPDVLTKVSMIGDNLQFDAGVGVCGKDGQSVPVGVGQPTIKVDGLTVGGTAT